MREEGNPAKAVTLAIAALFLFANGIIDTFIPDPARPVLKMAIDLLHPTSRIPAVFPT